MEGRLARLLLLALFQLAAGAAQACLFVKDVPPGQWYDWAAALFAGLRVPSRMWTSCRMDLPAVGDRVLVALNANHDTALVPLRPDHAAVLRERRTNGTPGGPNGARPQGQ